MAALPSHLIPATRVRRLWAGFANLFFVGLAIMLAGVIADHTVAPAQLSVKARLCSVGLISALWLFCVFLKRSLGAAVSLIEIRTHDGERPGIGRMILRTFTIFLLAITGAFPSELCPRWCGVLQLVLFFTLLVITTISAFVALVARMSLFDRISGTMVVQLTLPEHLKPRLFGIRIT